MAVSWYDPMEWDIGSFNQFGEYSFTAGKHYVNVKAAILAERQAWRVIYPSGDLVKWIRVGRKYSSDVDWTWFGPYVPKVPLIPFIMPDVYLYTVTVEWDQPQEDIEIFWALSYALVKDPDSWFMSDIVRVTCRYDKSGVPPGELPSSPSTWDVISHLFGKKETYLALGVTIGSGAAASVLPSPVRKYAYIGAAGGAAYLLYEVYKIYKGGI